MVNAEARIKTARRASYSLKGAGLCDIGGPKVDSHLWQVFILSRLNSGLDALALETEAVKKMEKFFMSQLHLFQFLSDSTVNATVYMLIGMPLLEAQLLSEHCMKRLLSIKRQLAMKTLKSHSWTVGVRKLLLKCNLPTAYHLYNNLPA